MIDEKYLKYYTIPRPQGHENSEPKLMVRVKVTKEQYIRANNLYDFGEKGLKNSIMGGGGNVYGALGEVIAMDYFNLSETDYNATKDYDLVMSGNTVDVKTEIHRVSDLKRDDNESEINYQKRKDKYHSPKLNYLCKIKDTSKHQECDFYLYTRVTKDYGYVWILGFILRKNFKKKATQYMKGDVDPTSRIGKTIKADCMAIQIQDLSLTKVNQFSENYFKDVLKFKIIDDNGYFFNGGKRVKLNNIKRNIVIMYKKNDYNIIIKDGLNVKFDGFCKSENDWVKICDLLKIEL
jgi:hypothetical protein